MTFEEHMEILERFLKKLEYHTASLPGKKSGFFVHVFKLLGLIISHNQPYADPMELKKCRGFLTPETPSELKGFIHFVGFYQMKIPEYPTLPQILFQLIKKAKGDTKRFQEVWKEDGRYLKAYEDLKAAMLKSVVVHRYDRARPLILATDASEECLTYNVAHSYK